MGEGERHGEPVGTVAEEAARLVQSLSGWAGGQAGPGAQSGTEPDGCGCSCHRAGESGHRAGGSAACRLCPVCQGIALLRAVRPETLERVADVAAMAATALHDLADQRRTDRTAPEEDGS